MRNPLQRQPEQPSVGPGTVNLESDYQARGAVNGNPYFTGNPYSETVSGRVAKANVGDLDQELPGWEVVSQLDTAEKNFTDAEKTDIKAAQDLVDQKLTILGEHSLERSTSLITRDAASKKFGDSVEEELREARESLQEKLKNAYVAHGVDEALFSIEASDDEESERARGAMNTLRLLSAADEIDKMTDAMGAHATDKYASTPVQPQSDPTTRTEKAKGFFKKGLDKLKKVGSKAVDAYAWASERKEDGKRRWGRTLVKGVATVGAGAGAALIAGGLGAGAAAAGIGYIAKKTVNAGFMGAVKNRKLRENIDERIADFNRQAKEALNAHFNSAEITDTSAGINAARKEVNSATRKNRVEVGVVAGAAAVAGGIVAETIDVGEIAKTASTPFRWAGDKMNVHVDNPFSQDTSGSIATDEVGTKINVGDNDLSELDVDGDGEVDADEIEKAIDANQPVTVMGQEATMVDVNDDGDLSPEELHAASPQDLELTGDTDSEGEIGDFTTDETAESLGGAEPTFEEMSHFTEYDYPSNYYTMDQIRHLAELASDDFTVNWHNVGDGNNGNDWISINGRSETAYVLAVLSRYAEEEAVTA